MASRTPDLQAAPANLPALSSRYVDVPALPWKPSRFPGVEVKP